MNRDERERHAGKLGDLAGMVLVAVEFDVDGFIGLRLRDETGPDKVLWLLSDDDGYRPGTFEVTRPLDLTKEWLRSFKGWKKPKVGKKTDEFVELDLMNEKL